MKKYVSCALVFLCIAFFASTSMAGEVVFVNTHAFPIANMRLVDVDSGRGYSLLETPLAGGEGLKVRLKEDGLWNLMAVDLNGSAIHFENIRFGGVKYIYIYPNGTLEIYR